MQTSRPPRIAPNEVIGGRYRVLAELGQGGMSVVYRAHDCLLDRQVALKLLRVSEEEPRNLLYLQQEFRAMVRLRHPRLVQVFDYGVLDSGSSYFSMELLPGEDLSNLGPLPLESVFHVLLSIADVLGFMHARGYVHRDVKPSNVRVLPTQSGRPIEIKLMDCGLTEQLGNQGTAVAGTLAYLAPEAWLGATTDVRGDLYALGVLAYEITAGQLPFDASTGVRLLQTKTERPRDLRVMCPEVPVEFARLIADLLTPEPTGRPASAMEVVSRLREFADIDYQPDPAVFFRTPSLVGRSQELLELRDAVTKARPGTVLPIMVTGSAGVGKTRLLDEALLEIGLRGAVVARASGKGFAGNSYHVLEELLASLMHLPGAEGALSRIGGRAALRPTRVASDPASPLRDFDPVAARRALHLAFCTFVDTISRNRRIVFAIDDIHLADSGSLDALAGMVSAGVQGVVAIVATLRVGEAVSQPLSHLLATSRRLTLDRMTREQIGALIVGALGPVVPSPSLVDDIERVSSGNVDFVLEILRDLAAQGLITRRRTKISLPDSLDAARLPQSLSEALDRRIARLSSVALRLARIGAVVGHEMDFEFARRLLGASDDDLLDAIDELRRNELMDVHDRGVRIHHTRMREVLYQGMAAAERQELHRRVALELERKLARDGQGEGAAELGHHFAEAGEGRIALEYLVKAADARYQAFAYFDARQTYQRALGLLEFAPRASRRELDRKLNDRLGRICFYHDHGRGPTYLECARHSHLRHGLLWAVGPLSTVLGPAAALVLCLIATILYDALRLRPHPVRHALERLVDGFAATTYLANCYNYTGRLPAALDAAERMRPYVYSRQRLPRVAYLMARAYTRLLMNNFDESAADCEEALTVLERDTRTPASEHDLVHATGGALITRLWVDLNRGYSHTSRWWKPLEQYVLDHPTALLEAWLMEARIFTAFRQGNVADIESAWTRLLNLASQAEVTFVHSKTRVWVGMAYLDVGRTSEAQDMADEVIAAVSALDNPLVYAHGLLLRGLALHAWDQLEDAERCLEEGARLTARDDIRCWELHHSILLARALLACDRGKYALATEFAHRVEKANLPLTLGHDLHRARASRVHARVALAERRHADADRHLESAHRLAAGLDDRLERARILHLLSIVRMESKRHSEAEACRMECIQLLGEIGNVHQLRSLGYAGSDNSESAPGSAFPRAIELASARQPRCSGSSQLSSSTDPAGQDPCVPTALQISSGQVRDETLVAADQSEPHPSLPA